MRIVMPSFEFVPGTVICLHIPHGCDLKDGIIEQGITELARHQGKSIAIFKPAGWESAKQLPLELTSADWLSHIASISVEESKKKIAGLGEKLSERIAEKLAWNAGTPRCLLGLVAALTRNPEVLAYSTVALDPEGISSIHKFVATRCRDLSVIHISHPSVYGDGSPHPRNCPSGARCIEMTEAI
jgi:hypothetical protein